MEILRSFLSMDMACSISNPTENMASAILCCRLGSYLEVKRPNETTERTWGYGTTDWMLPQVLDEFAVSRDYVQRDSVA